MIKILKEIAKHVNNDCLLDGELLDNQSWLYDVETAKSEGSGQFEIQACYTESKKPVLIDLDLNS